MKNIIKILSVSLISVSLFGATPNYVKKFSDLVRGGKKPQAVFNQETQNNKLCVIKCTMKTCGPCKRIAPQIKKMAAKYKEHACFIELDVNLFDNVIRKFNIRSVPSFIIYSQGRHLKTIKGSRKVNEISKVLDAQIRLFETP